MKEKENSEFNPVKFRLRIDLVSHPDNAGWGLVKPYISTDTALKI